MPTGIYIRTEDYRRRLSIGMKNGYKRGTVKIPKFNGKTGFKLGHIPWNKGTKGIQAGENHPMWKGGIKIHEQGYIYRWKPEHPFADNQGYVREHRLVMEEYIGRYLTKEEVVHHKNGVKTDNKIENLFLFISNSEHLRSEWKYKRERSVINYGETC